MIANFLEGDNMLDESPTRLTATLYNTRHTNCCQPQERHNRFPKSLPTYKSDVQWNHPKDSSAFEASAGREKGDRSIKYHAIFFRPNRLSYTRMYLNSFDLVTSYSPVSQRVCILDLFAVGGRTLTADHIAYYTRKPPT